MQCTRKTSRNKEIKEYAGRHQHLTGLVRSNIERCMKDLELLNRLLDQKLIDSDEVRKNSWDKYDVKKNERAQVEAQIQIFRNRTDLESPKPRTSEGHQLICELHSEILHLQASAVQPDPTPDFVIQDVRFGVRLQEAMIGSQKANIKSPQKDSEATQDSLNNWDEGDLHSIEAVHGRITEPPVSHPPQAGRGHEQLQRKEHSVPMRSAQIFRYDVPKAAPKLAAAPSTPPAGNLKDPPTVPNTSTPTTTLPTETTAPTITIPDYGGHQKKKPNTLLMTSGLNRQNSEVGNQLQKRSLSFFAISQSRYAMDWRS